MVTLTIERIVIVVLLLILVFFLALKKPCDQFAFSTDPDTGVIYRFDKQTGKVHWIFGETVLECGTDSSTWTEVNRNLFYSIITNKWNK